MERYTIERLQRDSFSFSRWRRGIKIWRELGIACKEAEICRNKEVFNKYAVGFLEGEKLYCRPKEGEVAVLFFVDGEYCWTHLRKKEFNYVFDK